MSSSFIILLLISIVSCADTAEEEPVEPTRNLLECPPNSSLREGKGCDMTCYDVMNRVKEHKCIKTSRPIHRCKCDDGFVRAKHFKEGCVKKNHCPEDPEY